MSNFLCVLAWQKLCNFSSSILSLSLPRTPAGALYAAWVSNKRGKPENFSTDCRRATARRHGCALWRQGG